VERPNTLAHERPIALGQAHNRQKAQKTQKFIHFCAFSACRRLFLSGFDPT
jgi:hypothetical protein